MCQATVRKEIYANRKNNNKSARRRCKQGEKWGQWKRQDNRHATTSERDASREPLTLSEDAHDEDSWRDGRHQLGWGLIIMNGQLGIDHAGLIHAVMQKQIGYDVSGTFNMQDAEI